MNQHHIHTTFMVTYRNTTTKSDTQSDSWSHRTVVEVTFELYDNNQSDKSEVICQTV